MPLDKLLDQIDADPTFRPAAIYARLCRLLAAPAPANSCLLPGAVGEVIQQIADELGLTCQPIGSTGNLGLEIGDSQAPLDLLLTAHMDRPCFRVRDPAEATLFPLCAVRVPVDGYRCEAEALRYVDGRVQVAAAGEMRFDQCDGGHRVSFSGALQPGDTLVMHATPRLRDGLVTATGLDNAAGVLLALLSARALNDYAKCAGRKIVFAFTDQEEGPPDGLFGQGAARLAYALPPPRLGFINIDGHNRDDATGHIAGLGASHAFVSGAGRGSVAPMDLQARTEALAAEVNDRRAGTVRLNYAYVSRSDDMLLSLWTRPLGLAGAIVENPHTAEERAALGDIESAARWIPAFVSAELK